MGPESIQQKSPEQVTQEKVAKEAEIRARIDNLRRGVDEDKRQIELTEQRIIEARANAESDKLPALEQNKANQLRDLTENTQKLENLKEELRRSYQ